MSQNPLNQPRRTEVHDVPHYQHPNALCFLHFSRGAAPGSLLEEFHNAFHERMRRKMQMANAEPQKCVTEKNLQACVSTPSSGIAPSSISIECGKPDVFSGMAQFRRKWLIVHSNSSLPFHTEKFPGSEKNPCFEKLPCCKTFPGRPGLRFIGLLRSIYS